MFQRMLCPFHTMLCVFIGMLCPCISMLRAWVAMHRVFVGHPHPQRATLSRRIGVRMQPPDFVPSGGTYPRLIAERPIDRACLPRGCTDVTPRGRSPSSLIFPVVP
jgi:hypothetical protein